MHHTPLHLVGEAPPADAFAHARHIGFDRADPRGDLTATTPASRDIAGTVARWREREAQLPVLDLTHDMTIAEDDATARLSRQAGWLAVALGVGIIAKVAWF